MRTLFVMLSLAAVVAFSIPAFAAPTSGDLQSFLNQANQINHEEQSMADLLKGKAGDNQALVSMANTIRDDHKNNESALQSLANQKNITLGSYNQNKAAEDRLENLQGAQFNDAFLNMNIRDHEKALKLFKEAKSTYSGDRDVQVYLDETIPVLEAHLKMAENLQRDDRKFGSPENPSNNQNNS